MNRPADVSRRDFLKASTAAAGIAALGPPAYGRVLGSNDRINFAVIGIGTMGSGHLRGLKRQMSQLNLDVIQTCDFMPSARKGPRNSSAHRPVRHRDTKTCWATRRSMRS